MIKKNKSLFFQNHRKLKLNKLTGKEIKNNSPHITTNTNKNLYTFGKTFAPSCSLRMRSSCFFFNVLTSNNYESVKLNFVTDLNLQSSLHFNYLPLIFNPFMTEVVII